MTDDSRQPQFQPPPGQGPYPPPQQPPQYGGQPYQMPPPYGYQQQPYAPRPVDSKQLRPKLWSIVVAWVVAVACIAAGIVLFVTGVLGAVTDAAPTKTFGIDQPTTVAIDPADRPAIYVAQGQLVHYECQISGGARLANTAVNQTVQLNGKSWELILVINAPKKGDYSVTCTTQEKGDTQFGVGRDLTGTATAAVGKVVAAVVIPIVGILVAVIVTIVVLVRRSGHRKRLATGG
ncbi:MAG: hypothetical protein HOY71_41695 [Nonomuraea sp.]|nr:hypothetical protein [Nonomuraea sp.]